MCDIIALLGEKVMENQNLVCSVVIPMYNSEKFIEQTIRSVMTQTIKNIEIICVDDCSTDNTFNIVKKLSEEDSRIVLYKNLKNSKVCATRNFGVARAKCDLIAFLDSDDLWRENHLELLIGKHKETGGKIIFSSYSFMTNDGKKLNKQFVVDDSINYRQLFYQNKILPSASMCEREVLKKYPFSSDELHEDFLCWLNILKDVNIAFGVKDTTTVYRLTNDSKSRNKFKSIIMSYKTYKQHGVKFFKRCAYTFFNAINGLIKYSKIMKQGDTNL